MPLTSCWFGARQLSDTHEALFPPLRGVQGAFDPWDEDDDYAISAADAGAERRKHLSSLLYLFGGVAPVAAAAVVALVRGERRPVLPALLVGAVVAWSLTWIGALLRLGTFLGASLEIGFWLQAVSIGVAVIGTILVATRRMGAHERGAAGLGA
jgi:hypothetical protein